MPEADEPRMLQLTQELFGAADPDRKRDSDATDPAGWLAALQATVLDFMTYFNAVTEDRRRSPRQDLASVIAKWRDRRRATRSLRGHELLHHRGHGRPRHHVLDDRRGVVGAGGKSRSTGQGKGRPRSDPPGWSKSRSVG